MSLQNLIKERRLKIHKTSHQELFDLRAVVERDLDDASIKELSTDRRFATAYNAVLQIGKMVIACAGYRVAGQGHHVATFEAIELIMGSQVTQLAAYFDTCRRKRNLVDYDMSGVATESETNELVIEAEHFRQMAERWIWQNYPEFGLPHL